MYIYIYMSMYIYNLIIFYIHSYIVTPKDTIRLVAASRS